MAITTLDGIVAGLLQPRPFLKVGAATVAGRWYSPFYVAGLPGAAVAPAPGIAGEALTTYAGQIPWVNPGAGNSYLARLSGAANVAGRLRLCDRLWHNSGISSTLTTSQTINSAAFPARDRTGTTNGEDIFIGAEVSTVMGAGTPTWTMGYTNSAGTAGRSIVTAAQAATMAVGSFIELPLAAGDLGVRSIQTWRASATMTSGVYHLVAYRVLAELEISLANVGAQLDAIACGFPRLFDNAVPFFTWLPSTTTAPVLSGSINFAQG